MKYEKCYVAISTMRGPLPPLAGVDHPSWSARMGRVKPAWLRLLCDSGRTGAGGEGKRKLPSFMSS
jgi:hypothetical protein